MADDAPLDTSGTAAVPYLSYPIPGIAHGAIPGLLGVALNGQAPPAPDEGGRKTITAEDLRNQLYREHGRPATFAQRFDAWPAVSPTRGGDVPAAPQTADFGAPPQVGAPPPQQSPDAQPPDAPPPGATPVSLNASPASAGAGSGAMLPMPAGAPAPQQPGSIPPESLLGKLFTNLGNYRDQNRLTLLALAGGLAGAPSIGTGLSRAFAAAVPAQRADIAQGQQNATVRALMNRMPGISQDEATAIASNPTLMQQIAGQAFGAKQMKFTQISHDKYGQPVMGWVDEINKKAYDLTGREITQGGGAATGAEASAQQNLHGEEYLATQSPTDAALIRAVAQGREQFPSGAALRTPRGQWLQDAVTQFEPGFNGQVWQQRQKAFNDWYGGGKSQETIKRISQATDHGQSLVQSLEQLGNSRFGAIINKPLNEAGALVGKTGYNPVVTNAHALADELAGIWKGSNLSDTEIKNWASAFRANGSIPQQKEDIGKLIELMEGGIRAKEEQHATSFGPHAAQLPPPVSPALRQRIDQLKAWAANPNATWAQVSGQAPSTPAAAPSGQAPAPATALPPGNYIYDPQSRRMIRQQ
jgi:hypothetical protein